MFAASLLPIRATPFEIVLKVLCHASCSDFSPRSPSAFALNCGSRRPGGGMEASPQEHVLQPPSTGRVRVLHCACRLHYLRVLAERAHAPVADNSSEQTVSERALLA